MYATCAGDGAQFCKAVERMFEENGLKIPSKWEDFNGRTFELTKDKLVGAALSSGTVLVCHGQP